MFPFLYLDADSCGDRLIAALRRFGLDVIAASESGLMEVSDTEQLAESVNLKRPILTANYTDFVPMHAQWAREGREHNGIVIWTHRRRSPESVAELVSSACYARTQEQFRNSLIWVS